ncbi:glycine oxidase ThiO [Bacillus cihuensis]|uniref:glycine oxidase ThiO n=1 Tax=Bacillus cihuensis TaxID=1208599 RepID=UPI0003FA4752|nr:glycine oxidase ThiO [Bacillus cihuensis]
MRSIYDAIVVGGGVIGGSIAYHLAKRGKQVLLLEKDRLACQASSAAAGMLGAQAELSASNPLLPLAKKSREMFPTLSAELKEFSGIDIEFINKGLLKVALTNEQETELKNLINSQSWTGEEEWLSTTEIKKIEPLISDDIRGAMYIPRDGQVSPYHLSIAFAKSAAMLGAEIKEFIQVRDLLFEDNRVKGVYTNEGEFFSENVIVASGTWSKFLLEKVGVKIDTYPIKGECFSIMTHRPLLEKTIFSHGCYLVPKIGGRIIVGATEKPHTFDQRVSIDGISALMEKAKRLLPAIKDTEFERAWAGLRPQTGDGLPYIDEHPEFHGLFIATGHYRNGILLSPITGQIVADLVERNASSECTAFRVDRTYQINY